MWSGLRTTAPMVMKMVHQVTKPVWLLQRICIAVISIANVLIDYYSHICKRIEISIDVSKRKEHSPCRCPRYLGIEYNDVYSTLLCWAHILFDAGTAKLSTAAVSHLVSTPTIRTPIDTTRGKVSSVNLSVISSCNTTAQSVFRKTTPRDTCRTRMLHTVD